MRRIVDLIYTYPAQSAWMEPLLLDGRDEAELVAIALRDGLGAAEGRDFVGVRPGARRVRRSSGPGPIC